MKQTQAQKKSTKEYKKVDYWFDRNPRSLLPFALVNNLDLSPVHIQYPQLLLGAKLEIKLKPSTQEERNE